MIREDRSFGKDFGLLILRVGIGAAFIVHGWPKLTGGPKGWEGLAHAAGMMHAPVAMGFIAAIVETLGGAMLILGLLLRPVAALLFIQMMVALFRVHLRSDNPAMNSFNAYSHALEDGIVFLALVFTGPGRYSLDAGMCCRRVPANQLSPDVPPPPPA